MTSDSEVRPAESGPAPDAPGPFEQILDHRFARPGLLREALTHRSAAHRRGRIASNERLEFMGDRVLGLLVAEWLVERYPREQEGELGRRLAHLVSQPVLAEVAEAIGLGAALAVSAGEARAGVMEAVECLRRASSANPRVITPALASRARSLSTAASSRPRRAP